MRALNNTFASSPFKFHRIWGNIQKRANLHFHVTKHAKPAVCPLGPFAYVFLCAGASVNHKGSFLGEIKNVQILHVVAFRKITFAFITLSINLTSCGVHDLFSRLCRRDVSAAATVACAAQAWACEWSAG